MILNRTKALLKERGITQDIFADKMIEAGYEGLHQSAKNSISNFSRNKGEGQRNDMLEFVCVLLNVGVGEVLEVVNEQS